MAGEWPETTLAGVSSDVSYGYTESATLERVGPRFLRITDIQNGVVDWSGVPFCPISRDDHSKYRLQDGDIVVARTGNSTGENYLFRGNEDAVFASYLIRFRIDGSTADPAFVWYHLRSAAWRRFINGAKTGSAQAGANARVLGTFSFTLPPLPEQKRIAHILGTLDDKIELNRRMNATLEAMSRAIFKSWFVDFDPVRQKAAGKQPIGMDAQTAALFPDSFEDSAIGEVPKGWGVVELGYVLELAYGKALKAEDRRSGAVPVFGSNGEVGLHDEALVDGPGIVVGRKGNPGVVTWAATAFFPIDTTFYVVPKAPCVSLYFLFFALQWQDLGSLGADSAVPGLNRNMAYMSRQCLPPGGLIAAYDKVSQAAFATIHAKAQQSRTLAALRDALLPKLLSGEVRVPEAEGMVEEAVR